LICDLELFSQALFKGVCDNNFKSIFMKNILAFLVAMIGFSILSVAQIQLFAKFTPGESVSPDINIFGYAGKINKSGSLKLTYFALVEKSWAEGLIGISYAPAKWCELGLQVGIESAPSVYRVSGSVFLALNSKTTFFTCMEKGDGKNNWWYKSTLSYCPKEKFSFGLMSWRYNGTGVFLKHTFLKGKLGLWINPAYDLEVKTERFTVGLDIKI